ncbi:MAG: DUF1819 family protein [Clostridiaceae bacterium]|nr:DUF1819 family protein [Dysgonamonadaceae bacterium]MDD4503742.1 DUF1819 family protein [Clostridiaceae bacterium]
MEYSAGMTSRPFWYVESKKTAKYILKGLDKESIRKIIVNENTYQAPSRERADHMFNSIYRRLNSLDIFLIEKIAASDVLTSKVLVMLSIMKTDQLFFEFMYEVFREKLLLGDYLLKDRDINVFFDNKRTQSDIVSKWTDFTINKMKSSYSRILYEVGLISKSSKDRKITPISLDYKLSEYLKEKGMTVYLYSITGES